MNPFTKPALPAFYLTRSTDVVESPMLTRLREERASTLQFVEQTISGAEEQNRDLSTTEKETLERSKKRVGELDEQIKPLADFEQLKRASTAGSAPFRPTGNSAAEPQGLGAQMRTREYKYRSAGEILADASKMTAAQGAVTPGERDDATSRLRSVGITLEGETLVRDAMTSADSAGILPEPIIGEILSNLDASRPFVSSVGPKDMGSIPGKKFTRPFISQHVSTGVQAAELDTLTSRKLVIGDVEFTKKTRGGYVSISRQDLDWTSPAAWDALLKDFQDVYGIDSEDASWADFDAAIPALGGANDLTLSANAEPTIKEIIKALYAGYRAVYGVRKSMAPVTMWQSLDEWELWGAVIDEAMINANGSQSAPNENITRILQTPRIVVPGAPDGTSIIGAKDRVEIYEQRLGFLSAIQPKVLGIDLAYGGYIATGVLKPTPAASVPFFRYEHA